MLYTQEQICTSREQLAWHLAARSIIGVLLTANLLFITHHPSTCPLKGAEHHDLHK